MLLWYRLQGVGVMVDLCGRGWDQEDPDDAHCVARAAWTRPGGRGPWVGGWPLQVGGLAHTPPRPETQGWSTTPTPRPLTGCLSHLRVNGQVRTVGVYGRGWLRAGGLVGEHPRLTIL